MAIFSKAGKIFRGDVDARDAASEALRRVKLTRVRRRERASLVTLDQQPARLREEFARIRAGDLLAHFRTRTNPKFFPGFEDLKITAELQHQIFPQPTARLLSHARLIAQDHRWPLLGFGEQCFGADEINWNRDPLSGYQWPLDYHADINLLRNDGSDARVTWELNRLGHLITLGRAFALSGDEQFSREFFRQVESWRRQNPVGRGINWNCAMEVALRAINLLAAFKLFLHAPQMNEIVLKDLLAIFDQHGAHIERNLEFSHIATSNHYLSDVVGLLWLGVMLPELEAARGWREFGRCELLREMDKQVLADGADYEASTGYHRLTLELWLYSFVLCHVNGIDIEEKYWSRLRSMLDYLRAYLRPDGFAPLLGDSDSGQILPLVRRGGDDHAYLLELGAAVFQEGRFKPAKAGGGPKGPEELLWLLGEQGVRDYDELPESGAPQSEGFPQAGTYFLRANDLYLCCNCSGSGINGRGSHGHNDALSIEVSVAETHFLIDPGSYVYTANLADRHRFRSTAYHSTVQVDEVEQNRIDESLPWTIGNDARPHVLKWETSAVLDLLVAEHLGYRRLAQPVTHRRSITFEKTRRYWLMEDDLTGEGTHEFAFRFHCAPGLDTDVTAEGNLRLCDKMSGARLFISPLTESGQPGLEAAFASTDYGAKQPSVIACWTQRSSVPLRKRWAIIPLRANEDETVSDEIVAKLRAEPVAS